MNLRKCFLIKNLCEFVSWFDTYIHVFLILHTAYIYIYIAFLQWDPENCEIIGRRLLDSSFDFSSMNIKHNNGIVCTDHFTFLF